MQETLVLSLGQEDPLEEEIATYTSIFAWEFTWTEEASGLQSMGSQRVGHDLAMKTATTKQTRWRFFSSLHPEKLMGLPGGKANEFMEAFQQTESLGAFNSQATIHWTSGILLKLTFRCSHHYWLWQLLLQQW